ncbi:MAG: SH3-like domain-containing protein [Pseudomonadota bacterium]
MSYGPGTQVRVRALSAPGHMRTPSYLRGKTGEIERALGAFKNPEQLAYCVPADHKALYRVRFSMKEVWGDAAERPSDFLEAEIYEHWLEPA